VDKKIIAIDGFHLQEKVHWQRNWPILGLCLCRHWCCHHAVALELYGKKYISADTFDKDSLIKVCLLFV
jgi:hypothetical protein